MMPPVESGERTKDQLWQRLAAFEFDELDAALPFSRRLARDNGWSHADALAAIEEYRRFVFLAMVASPSAVITRPGCANRLAPSTASF